MSINPLTFGSPVYSPAFAVSSGDTGVMKLRSRESSPLTHESLDENFTNLANKINEILGLKVDLLDIGTDGKMGLTNLALSSGTGIDLSATGQFSHQARPAAESGWSSADKNSSSLEFISGLAFDSLGHVQGYKSGNLSFASSGHIGVSNTGNVVTVSSTAYGSGDSPTFAELEIEKDSYSTLSAGAGHIVLDTIGVAREKDKGPFINFRVPTSNTTSEDMANIGAVCSDSTASSRKADLVFWTRDTTFSERMRITSDGNVGIGTTSPDTDLHVKAKDNTWLGGLKLEDHDSEDGWFLHPDTGGGLMIGEVNASNPSTATDRLTVRKGGNVGIGTTTPDVKLLVLNEIENTYSNNVPNVSNCVLGIANKPSNEAINNHASLQFNLNAGTHNHAASISLVSESSTLRRGALAFCTDNGTTRPEAMRIDSVGNVGIGTTSPDYPLEVSGWVSAKADAPSTEAVINLVASNSTKLVTPAFDPPTSIARIKCISESDLNSSSALTFLTRNSSDVIGERMRITSGGNVGIGQVTNPETFDGESNQLVIRDVSHAGMTICAGNTSSRSNIYFADGNSGSERYRGGIAYDHADDDLSFRAGSSEAMWLKANGRLGVNTSLPSSTFHVRGAFGDPAESGQDLNGIARFGQVQGAGVLDIGFGDPYSWIQSRASTDYSVNYDLALQPNGKSVIVGSKETPQAKLHVAQTSLEPTFEIQYRPTEGGFYKHLGCVSHTGSHVIYPFVHVRLRTVWNDEGMFSIRARGYLPYGTVMDCTTGMY